MKKKRPRSAIIVFAREPKEGKVKTRLGKALPDSTVTKLYKAFIRDVLDVAIRCDCDGHFIYYAGHGASIPFLRRQGKGFQLKRQFGGDLGERMYGAALRCLRGRFDKVVIIGTDCLSVKDSDIERAFTKLDTHDYVFGPTKDGGYYLIGLKRPDIRLFRGIRWSTPEVFDQTIKKARKLDKKIFLMRKLADIDTFNDLIEYSYQKHSPAMAPQTRKILKKIHL